MFYHASSSFEPDVVLMLCTPINTKTILFAACLSPCWATTMGRLLGPKMQNSKKCLSQGHSDALPHRESEQTFDY